MVVLSVVLPKFDKVRVLQEVHDGSGRAPVLLLATGDSIRSGMSNLSLNTGSCVAGPFRVRRLLTEVQTTLEVGSTNARRPTIRSYLRISSLGLGRGAERIDQKSGTVRLAPERFSLLICLVAGGERILGERRVLRTI